jgi:gliding motility-associated-like protein
MSICEGETFIFNGSEYIETGIYIDTFSATSGCDSILLLSLVVHPNPTISAGPEQELTCLSPTVILEGETTGADQFYWDGPGINETNQHLLTPPVNLPGHYILTVISQQGCMVTDTVVVTVSQDVPVADAGPDLVLSCIQDSVELFGSGTGLNLIYHWVGPGINENNMNAERPLVSIPGEYTLIVMDSISSCSSFPDTMEVMNIQANVLAVVTPPDTLDCFLTSITLDGSASVGGSGTIYRWEDMSGNILSVSPTFNIDHDGMFLFFVVDTISGCFDSDSIQIVDMTEYPPASAGPDMELTCNHDTVLLNADGNLVLENVIYQWTGPDGGLTGEISTISVHASLPGDYIFTATDTTNGCSNSDTVLVSENNESPIADAGPDKFITCSDLVVPLDGSNSSVGDQFTYLWTGPSVSGHTGLYPEVEITGMYALTVMNLLTGCSASDTVIVDTLMNGPESANLFTQDPLCYGDTNGLIEIQSVSGGEGPYTYSLDGILFSSDERFQDLPPGYYSVIVKDNAGCELDTFATLFEPDSITLDVDPAIEILLGEDLQLEAETNISPERILSVSWNPTDHLSCADCLDPLVEKLYDDHLFEITLVDINGCVARDEISILVDDQSQVYIPNIFTPNGDGSNDFFSIATGLSIDRIQSLEIFDRWGEKVFIRQNFEPNIEDLGWDGTIEGRALDPAVFVYLVKLHTVDGRIEIYSGDVTLAR